MASLVDEYAMGKIGLQTPSGNVIGICRNRVSDSIYHRFPPHGREPDFNYKILNMTTPVYLVSFVFGELLVLVGCVLALKWNLKEVVKMSYTYSYKHYELWWGVTCFWFIPVPILLYCDVLVAMSGYPEYGTSVQYPASTILLVVIIVPGLIIAGYFTYKTKPPAVPYILMIPVAALLCCCSTQRAKLLVFGIALWINVVAAKLIMLFAILIILAILAEPEVFDAKWETYFDNPNLDGFGLRKGLNELYRHDLVPEPKIVVAMLKAARRLNDVAMSICILGAVKDKAAGDLTIYNYIINSIKPTLEDLGISTPEELGLDRA